MDNSIVFNKNTKISQQQGITEIYLRDRSVKIIVSNKTFNILVKVIKNDLRCEGLDKKLNADFIKLLDLLLFHDITLMKKDEQLIENGLIQPSLRINQKISRIPEKRISPWCLFGAPADFARDPPRSPIHGPYIFRTMSKLLMHFEDIGDIIWSNDDDMIFFGKKIKHIVNRIYCSGNKFLMVGGDHSLTYFVLEEISKNKNGVYLVQFDAHSDMNPSLQRKNKILNHSNMTSKIITEKIVDGIIQIGVRGKEIKKELNGNSNIDFFQCHIDNYDSCKVIKLLENKDIYISIDLDVIDPSIFPHVTTPLDKGMSGDGIIHIINNIKKMKCRIIGADIVEFTCGFDKSGVPFNYEFHLLDKIIKSLIN